MELWRGAALEMDFLRLEWFEAGDLKLLACELDLELVELLGWVSCYIELKEIKYMLFIN
jgi:hypothetical protein